MKTISIFALSAATLFMGACDWVGIRGNGNIVTDRRTIGSFSEIYAGGALRVDWRAGAPSLTITTDENLLPYIETHNNGNRLELRTREHIRPTHGIKVAVSSPALSGVKLNGAADVTAHAVSGPKFFLQSRGASGIVVDGTVDELLADLTGASDLKAKGLQAKVVEISTTGAADAQVSVSETLRVVITGAGDVTYWGNPKTVERRILGAGDIRHKD